MDDAFQGYGLRSVELADQAVFSPFFASLRQPLSDYTFSQIYTWRNSLHLFWKILQNHLCIFANGSGDLTLLAPPIGDGHSQNALLAAFELMNDYNASAGVPDRSRVEYVSEELLARLDRANLDVLPMGTDYVYDVQKMIDLPGGDLASKRQAKNRFLRLYQHRLEIYDPAVHLDGCLNMLSSWRVHQDAQHLEESNLNCVKRQKEVIATELALRSSRELGLAGLVVYVKNPGSAQASADAESASTDQGWSLRGFTLGETLSQTQSSIVIEKTDLETKGLAQFIFSEFCRRNWSHLPLTNVGDDWGLESLSWTKMSYRPVQLLQKYTLKQRAPVAVATGGIEPSQSASPSAEPVIRAAAKPDLAATVELESACFSSDFSLKKRQLQYLQQRPSAIFLVAERGGAVVGEGIALLRQHKTGLTGRVYSLAVNQCHRGQKIGQRLLKSMVNELASRGVQRVYLEVEKSNSPALALYESQGFEQIGVLPNYYGPGRDAHHMMHKIAPRS